MPYKYVIHTLAPMYKKSKNPKEELINTYLNAINLAKENNIQSSTDYLLITSLKDKFTYVYEYKNGWELEYKWSSTVGKSSTPTIKGVFSVGIKYPAIGGNTSSVKYATNIVDDYYYHSIIYDDKGTTWMIRSDSKTDSNYFNMTGPKSIKNGKYKMETVHTVDMPSGYWPKSTSKTTTSAWLTVN